VHALALVYLLSELKFIIILIDSVNKIKEICMVYLSPVTEVAEG